ncbi:uncharacterized protein LOC143371682 [Andrena cerasifolii]|uniref:uncharacterized protein LOC143371682 n=1 Tax=Andrena cerasifolii TaxID=2819439 RepID=UPI0040379EFE
MVVLFILRHRKTGHPRLPLPPGDRKRSRGQVKRRIPADFTTDFYIEQLDEDPRLFLDFRMGKRNYAALVNSDSIRSYMRIDVAARLLPSRRHTGHQLVPDHSSRRDNSLTGRRDHPDYQGSRIGGPAHIHHHGRPHPGSTPGDGLHPEARAHALSRTAPMAVQRRNRRDRRPGPKELHACTGSPTQSATGHRTSPLPTDTRAHPPS